MKVHKLLLFSCRVVSDSLWPHGLEHNRPSFPYHLQEFAQVRVHWIGNAIQPTHPLPPLLLLSSILPSIRVLSSELALCIRCPKYWNFSFNNSPSNEYSGLTSFRTDWSDSVMEKAQSKQITQTESRVVVAWGCQEAGKVKSHGLMSSGFPLMTVRRLWNWIVMMVPQHYEYAKCHWIVHFKMGKLTLCVFTIVKKEKKVWTHPYISSVQFSSVAQ